MNKALIVVYHFPPLGGGAVMRTLKFVKYLPQFGWQPIVLTVDSVYYAPQLLDRSLLDEVPASVAVHRTRSLRRAKRDSPRLMDVPTAAPARPKGVLRAWLRRFKVSHDYGFRWLPLALPRALSIIREKKVDLLFTTSPPHNVHLLGLLLNRRCGIPWVADFRDGWMRTEMFVAKSAPRRMFDSTCERAVIRAAAHIICATEPISSDFREGYPGLSAKIHTLYNGFDPADFVSEVSDHDPAVFRITHVGSLTSSHRSPEVLVRAASSFARKNPRFAHACSIQFIGPIWPSHLDMISSYGLGRLSSTTGMVSHAEAIQAMRAADVLLLLFNYKMRYGEGGILTGKFGEYVRAGKPILAVVPEGIAADFVRQHNLGLVVAPEDVDATEQALTDLFGRWQRGTLKTPEAPELIQLFDRRRSTQRLAQIFADAVARKAK